MDNVKHNFSILRFSPGLAATITMAIISVLFGAGDLLLFLNVIGISLIFPRFTKLKINHELILRLPFATAVFWVFHQDGVRESVNLIFK
jgi:hypothetical protein